MPSPIDSLRFVHAAIISESARIADACRRASDGAQLAPLADDVAYFETLNERHTRGEELGLFPPLAERAPQIDVTYLLDHEIERALFTELREAIAAADLEAARTVAERLEHHCATHVRKENDLILPFVAEHFSPPEQGEMVGKIVSTIPPEDMAQAVPWIISRLEVGPAVAYVEVLAKVMPPPAFEKMRGAIQGGIPEAMWGALREQAPSLEGA